MTKTIEGRLRKLETVGNGNILDELLAAMASDSPELAALSETFRNMPDRSNHIDAVLRQLVEGDKAQEASAG